MDNGSEKIGGRYMYNAEITKSLNEDIKSHFPKVFTIDETMSNAREGVSRLVMIDRYAQKDVRKETLKVGDVVIAEIIPHPDYPTQGIGRVKGIDGENVSVELEEEFAASMSEEEKKKGYIVRNIDLIEKPVELYYEQIAKRVSRGLGDRKSTRLNSSHVAISYAVFCLKKKKKKKITFKE